MLQMLVGNGKSMKTTTALVAAATAPTQYLRPTSGHTGTYVSFPSPSSPAMLVRQGSFCSEPQQYKCPPEQQPTSSRCRLTITEGQQHNSQTINTFSKRKFLLPFHLHSKLILPDSKTPEPTYISVVVVILVVCCCFSCLFWWHNLHTFRAPHIFYIYLYIYTGVVC